MKKFFGHLRLILKHRHRVIKNGWHCGIFWHCLRHDLSKFSPTEFWRSVHFYAGDHSPVLEERLENGYFSLICQHHAKRNKHHWEYWTDFFMGTVVIMTMPWVYATEYVCDTLAASYCYDPKTFTAEKTLDYFLAREERNYMTQATKAYIRWCLTRFRDLGWKGLKKKATKAKYAEIIASFPKTEMLDSLRVPYEKLPPDAHEFIIPRDKS